MNADPIVGAGFKPARTSAAIGRFETGRYEQPPKAGLKPAPTMIQTDSTPPAPKATEEVAQERLPLGRLGLGDVGGWVAIVEAPISR